MPSSRPNTIPTVIHLVRQLKPQSILDVGVGFGKWGHLFREYTDILEAENDPARYQRKNWRVKIDGIEGHAAYLTAMHRFIYDQIHVGDAGKLIKKLPGYDLIFLGDIIEHFEKEAGMCLLRDAVARARKAVIVSTPKYETDQVDLCGNELERHRSLWSAKDFRLFENTIVRTIDRATILAVIVKSGVPTPRCTPPPAPKQRDVERLRKIKHELARLIAPGEIFILVDEDQFRSELPYKRVLPFLENKGKYWGPPADDATAIRELERLRKRGARYIGFVWSAFWWLDYYPDFAAYLRERFNCVVQNKALAVFDLHKRQ